MEDEWPIDTFEVWGYEEHRIMPDLFCYYGVTGEDISSKSGGIGYW